MKQSLEFLKDRITDKMPLEDMEKSLKICVAFLLRMR